MTISVNLLSVRHPRVEITIRAWLDESGLTVHGHDVGPAVEDIWDRDDYESFLAVAADRLGDVQRALGDELRTDRTRPVSRPPPSVLDGLRRLFGSGRFRSTTDLRSWLDAHDIDSRFWSS